MKLARYKSNSRTETEICRGFTQRFGCRQSGDFSKRSPSVLSNGIALNRITITKSKRHTLSACRRQSMRRIFPFWSGFESTQTGGRFPVILMTKSSRHSWVISFRSFAKSREAHFCLISAFSFWNKNETMSIKDIAMIIWTFWCTVK